MLVSSKLAIDGISIWPDADLFEILYQAKFKIVDCKSIQCIAIVKVRLFGHGDDIR